MAVATAFLTLNAYLRNSGYHEAAWRVGAEDPAAILDPAHYVKLAKITERGIST
jgi:N-acetyl-S-(2-succino)cysteine monooxygenase